MPVQKCAIYLKKMLHMEASHPEGSARGRLAMSSLPAPDSGRTSASSAQYGTGETSVSVSETHELRHVPLSELCDFTRIGRGPCGDVFAVDWTGQRGGNEKPFAVKRFYTDRGKLRPDQEQALTAEATLFQSIAVRHANVIKLLGLVDDIDSKGVPFYGFVMPRMCDVRDAIRARECDLTQRLAWIADVASGLAFLHESGVVHGHLQVRAINALCAVALYCAQLVRRLRMY